MKTEHDERRLSMQEGEKKNKLTERSKGTRMMMLSSLQGQRGACECKHQHHHHHHNYHNDNF
jgi:hypothetical protein